MIAPSGSSLLLGIGIGLASLAAVAASEYPVAGLAPDQRPANAPRLTADAPVDTTRSLHGIPAPRPAGLEFVEAQGGWYTPFDLRGMPGPYDLRGWHSQTRVGEKK
ncbi:MAG: hypothetical protein E6R10_06315 [Rhodocyclaceae bacterium]|nr:MAG: hypothetical protein E6R10_06315 [Rhodocyclaceae bacterium]